MTRNLTNSTRNLTESQREAQIQDEIRLELGNPEKYPDVLLFRNNTGVLQDKNGKHIRFGLAVGSADLIGIFTPGGRFLAAEIKTDTGRQSDEQVRFEQLINQRGGAYAVLRSVEDARAWIARLRKGEE